MATAWTDEEFYLVTGAGYALYRQGRNRDAAVIFEGLVSLRPNDIYCLESMAALYVLLGDYQRALAHLNTILTLDPNHTGARARSREVWWRLGRYDQAQHDYERIETYGDTAQAARLRFLLQSAPALPYSHPAQLPPGPER